MLIFFHRKTQHKELAISFQFPPDYPKSQILFELKSKVLADRLLDGLTKRTEQEAEKLLGQYQVGIELCAIINN